MYARLYVWLHVHIDETVAEQSFRVVEHMKNRSTNIDQNAETFR